MISGTLTEKELLDAYRFRRTKTDQFFYLSFALAVVSGFFIAWRGDRTLGYILMGLGTFEAVFFFFALHTLLPWRVRKSYRTRNELRSLTTWRWNPETVTVETANFHLTREWSQYKKAFENSQFFLLSIGGPLIQIIPKRWFQSEAQINEFKKYALARRA